MGHIFCGEIYVHVWAWEVHMDGLVAQIEFDRQKAWSERPTAGQLGPDGPCISSHPFLYLHSICLWEVLVSVIEREMVCKYICVIIYARRCQVVL